MEEFAHINGWEAYSDEEPSTEKPSSKTSSRVSTPIAEVESKKAEQEPAKVEAKETKTEKEEVEDKGEPMEVEKDEGGIVQQLLTSKPNWPLCALVLSIMATAIGA